MQLIMIVSILTAECGVSTTKLFLLGCIFLPSLQEDICHHMYHVSFRVCLAWLGSLQF